MNDFVDLHTHTIASGHAYSTIGEMVHAAALKKLPVLGISEHAPSMPGSCQEIYFCNFKVIPRVLEGVRVLFGCELNIIDYEGTIDLCEKYLKRLDYAIASLHDLCLKPGTREQNTHSILQIMKNPYVKIIGHPDDGKFPTDYEALVKGAKEHHKLIEINNHSLDPDGPRLNAWENSSEILKLCKIYQVPVIMSSDAHFMSEVANHSWSEKILRATDFPAHLVTNYSLELLAEYIPAVKE